jgi:hypothetical protein
LGRIGEPGPWVGSARVTKHLLPDREARSQPGSFLLSFGSGYSYRAEPVPPGAISAQDLRNAMNAIYPPAG